MALDLYFEDLDTNRVTVVHPPYFESEPKQATPALPCPTKSKIEAIEAIEAVSEGSEMDSGHQLSTVVNLYVSEAKTNWAERETKTQQALFDSFIKFVGNKDIHALSKQDAVTFKNSLKNSALTINKKIYKLQALFEYIQNHYETSNIFNGLLIKRVSSQNKRSAYTNNEIKTLLSFADCLKEKHKFRKHLVYLSVFTGARANELAQLRKSDVVSIKGHWCISINDDHSDKSLKTPSARRIVPLNTQLLKSGFMEYIEPFGEDERLFPELAFADGGYSKYYAAWFGRCNPIKAHNLHELRHTLATRLKEANCSLQVAAALLGHTTGNNMTFETYGSGASIPVELLKDAIEMVSYA